MTNAFARLASSSLCCILLLGAVAYSQTSLTHMWSNALNNYQPGRNTVVAAGVEADGAGNIYLIGSVSGVADFDPGGGTALRGASGRSAIFLAKYNASGAMVFANVFYADTDDLSFTGIALDKNANIIVCGIWKGSVGLNPSNSGVTNSAETSAYNFFVARYSTTGALQYSNGFGSNGYDGASDIAVDQNGYIVVVGQFQGVVDFAPGSGTYNLTSYLVQEGYYASFFIAKYNADGSFIYAKALLGNINMVETCEVALGATGNPAIAGTFNGTYDFDPGPNERLLTSAGETDVFLAAFDVSGGLVFANRFGNAGYDWVKDLARNSFGDILMVGEFGQTVDFDPGPGTLNLTSAGQYDMFLAQYNSLGSLEFARKLNNYVKPTSVKFDATGNFLISGFFKGTIDFDPGLGQAPLTSSTYWYDHFITKYDANGNFLDAKAVINTTEHYGSSIYAAYFALSPEQEVYLVRAFQGTLDVDPGPVISLLSNNIGYKHTYVLKLSQALALQSKMQIGGFPTAVYADEGRALARDAQCNVYLAGKFAGSIMQDKTANIDISEIDGVATSIGFDDVFVAKYDSNGYRKFIRSFGSAFNDNVHDMGVDGNGNMYITGTFQGTADFDPGASVFNLTSAGGNDIFLMKLTTNGDFVYARRLGGSGPDVANGLAVDAAGNVVLAGSFSGTVDFDPGAGTTNLSSAGLTDIFFAKYDASGNYVFAKRIGGPDNDFAKDVVMDGGGNLFITGIFSNTDGMDFDPGAGTAWLYSDFLGDVFLARYDAIGNYSFAKKLWGTGTETVSALAIDAYGHVSITGEYTGQFFISPNTLPASNYNNIYLAKFDGQGTNLFTRSIGGDYYAYPASLAIGCGESIWMTGYFSRTIDFDPSAATANLTSTNNSNDVFIAKYDLNGDYVYAGNAGGQSDDRAMSITGGLNGTVYVTGRFEGFADFNPGPAEQLLKSDNNTDVFLASYREATTSLKTYKNGSWFDPATWGNCIIPNANTPVVVDHEVNIPNNAACRSIMIRGTGKVQLAAGKTLSVVE